MLNTCISSICIGLKKICLGVLDRRERDKNNETGLKEGGGIEMSTTVLSIYETTKVRIEMWIQFFKKKIHLYAYTLEKNILSKELYFCMFVIIMYHRTSHRWYNVVHVCST